MLNARLIAEEGDLKGMVFTLDEGDRWVIGRDPKECEFVIEDPSASRRHLVCLRTSEGIVIENLSETNPTKVNEEELVNPRLLEQGDTVKIGNELFRFYADNGIPVSEQNIISATDNKNSEEVDEEIKKPIETVKEENMETVKEEELIPINQEESKSELDQEEESGNTSDHDSIFEESEGEKPQIAEINFGVTETGRWLLKVIGGPNNGAEFYMQSPQNYLIGTDPLTCDIVFHDTSVSRQHARITVNPDETLTIEDLNSRNGILVNGQLVKEKELLQPSIIVTLGTTSFVVYDREGEMQTIISPLLPSIVKVLQKEEQASDQKEASPQAVEKALETGNIPKAEDSSTEQKNARPMSRFALLAIISAVFIVVGIGTTTLFKDNPVVAVAQEHISDQLKQAISPFPAVQYSFNKGTGNLLLIGHVKTGSDKTQLLYNLQGLKFIKFIDDSGIIIDEGVWNEINQILTKNPDWKGISVYSPSAGQFVITGYLETRKQAEKLSSYLSINFPYVDLLQQKIVIEEDITNQINALLQDVGIREIKTQMTNGEISFTGSIPNDKVSEMEKILTQAKDIPGVRAVKNYVTKLITDSGLVNVSDRYDVSGISSLGNGKYTVAINGRLLSVGDNLDGMKITDIQPGKILLEEGGIKYRIDFNK